DLVDVTGTVTLSGATLHVAMPAGALNATQTFTVIANDGTDPVSGTFAGLAEGATITLGGGTLRISYIGGDGNDVVLLPASATKSWSGASSALWSDAANWTPAVVPASGEPLLFPAGATRTTMTNDLPV